MYIFIIISIIVVFALLYFILSRSSRKLLTSEEAKAKLDDYFTKFLLKSGNQTSIQIAVNSRTFDYRFANGYITADNNKPVSIDQPFHTASIGKVFTAVLIMKLFERDMLTLDDPIVNFLGEVELEGLFVCDNIDYSKQVTIRQLLGHTSGIADYFESSTVNSQKITDLIISQPNTFWTPKALIDFTRHHQKAVAAPGTRFYYSDTGYILLGLIIESVTGISYGENLQHELFEPLQMEDSYLMFYTEPKRQPKKSIQDIWLNGIEISRFQSLSCDWSGGGTVTTLEDLLRFQKALRSGQIIHPSSLKELDTFDSKFRTGLRYGLGMMEVRFEEFFFMLRGLPKLRGHIGILATHMFSDSSEDTSIVMNFGSTSSMVKSFRALIEVTNTLSRIREH
ncbi:serine hydrolase domain-containing protein [Saccharibacillus kuerlensis]|uniref:Beta-lactamase-related domain-containing protein n=1 Tax=Saccharibacillus kuerlensis TaxID=459527 RepID=A0ABQ2KVJ9_9BACL|nr:serine hydrolase [Saccharibacillus kuerlensis]GGN91714.1 hypothetical protein GCM10010969_03510 [Saccharibacillus kuerlensis]